MVTQNHIQELLTDLAKENVRFVVAGGVAVVLHGIDRATMDIDLAVDLATDNLEKFLKVMKIHNMKPRAPVPSDFILDPKNVKKIITEKNAKVFTFTDPTKAYKQVDIFLTDELSFKEFSKNSVTINLANTNVQIASIEKLIESKQNVSPPREKDKLDIIELNKLRAKDD